jgi:flagellar protein FlgJ
MRESTLNEGLMDSDQSKFYQGMFDQQIALEMTRGKGLGLADMLVRHLGGSSPTNAEQGIREPADPFLGPATPLRRTQPANYSQQPPGVPNAPAAPNAHGNSNDAAVAEVPLPDTALAQWRPQDRDQFVADLWPHAEQAARELGVDARVLLAQAALETGWGQHIMQRRDGRSSHNLFGIKADGRWDGEQVSHRTVEFRHGVLQREQAAFRAYATPAHSLADYADFIRDNPRYADALGSTDPRRYVTELQRAGYATDPAYARKIMNIYNSDEFQYAVAVAQSRERLAATQTQEVSAVDTRPMQAPPQSSDDASRRGEEG